MEIVKVPLKDQLLFPSYINNGDGSMNSVSLISGLNYKLTLTILGETSSYFLLEVNSNSGKFVIPLLALGVKVFALNL